LKADNHIFGSSYDMIRWCRKRTALEGTLGTPSLQCFLTYLLISQFVME